MENQDDWCVDCSDDEKYSHAGAEKGVWEPNPQIIKELYEKLATGEEFTLNWSWPRGRRSPSPELCEEDMDKDMDTKEPTPKEEKQAPTEFDFDDSFSDAPLTALTPRRTPGSKTPRSTQKRVARMDKIMDDLRKEKKSMSPGQRTMVPGHRPLPGLGGAHRATPRTGTPGSQLGIQRTPGSGIGGVNPRSQSPAAAQAGPQQQAVSGHNVAQGAVAQRLTTDVAKASSGSSTVSTPSVLSGNAQAISSADNRQLSSNEPLVASSSEQTKPTQVVTMVHPPPGEGTPHRPALPKLKIRKDMIS